MRKLPGLLFCVAGFLSVLSGNIPIGMMFTSVGLMLVVVL